MEVGGNRKVWEYTKQRSLKKKDYSDVIRVLNLEAWPRPNTGIEPFKKRTRK